MRKKVGRALAMDLVEQLIAAAPDQDTKDLALALRERIRIPMTAILIKMPGESVADKSRKLGISRTTYYAWTEGKARPRRGLAERVAEYTGFTWQEIAGYPPGWDVP